MCKCSKKYLLISVLSAVLLCGCTKKNTVKNPAEEENAASTEKENSASNVVSFEGKDMDGNTFSAENCADSRLTMINVWATYCNPCLSEMPELGELTKEYEAEDFQLIGIVSDVLEGQEDESLEYALSLIEETGADYPHLLLNESLYKGLLTEVTAVPTTFFLNKDGEILDVIVGAMDKSKWKEKIDALLEEL